MDNSDDHKQDIGSQGSKRVENKKTLDTFFPSKWLMILMVGIVLVFNIIVGMKVFSLQQEKAVVEILKARYESYAKIIRDVEDKEERLRILTQEIVPLEKRVENAQKEVGASNERLESNKDELNKIKASKAEIVEELRAAHTTIAELSNDKQTLRTDKETLEKLVAELNINEKGIDDKIKEKRKILRDTEENISAAEVRLKNQQEYIKDVAAANSNFDEVREQLLEFIKKMDETKKSAGERIKDFKEVIANLAEEKDRLSTQAINLTNEAKTIAQSNASIKEEISGFEEQNKKYKSEIENLTSISGQMKNITGTIQGTATNIEIDEKIVSENARAIKENLGEMTTANQEFVQTSKQFTAVVADVTSQREKLDTYMQEIADLPDMELQAIAFKKVLNEIEEITRKLSERVSAIQSNFDGKLDGMNLSFGSLEKNFTDLLLKLDGVEQALEKIATRAQKVLKQSQTNPLPSE